MQQRFWVGVFLLLVRVGNRRYYGLLPQMSMPRNREVDGIMCTIHVQRGLYTSYEQNNSVLPSVTSAED